MRRQNDPLRGSQGGRGRNNIGGKENIFTELLRKMDNQPRTYQNGPRIYLWGMGEYDIPKHLYITRNWKFRPLELSIYFGQSNIILKVKYNLEHRFHLLEW